MKFLKLICMALPFIIPAVENSWAQDGDILNFMPAILSGRAQAQNPSEFGSSCTENADCSSGVCLDESASGLPGGMCSYDCSADPSSCPAGGVCLEGVCLPGCTSDADCRSGYSCFDDFAASPVCYPDCNSDAQCPSIGGCNQYTGLCAPLSGLAIDGAPCASNSDCESGFCLTESSYGFPGGYCSSTCSLAKDNCAGDNSCVSLLQSSLTGLCLDGCVSNADCREGEGYTCQSGVCIP